MMAHSGMVRMTGPKSGVGTVKAATPTISNTASAACCAPTIEVPSVNTAQ